jgi:8-oxo-dGTP pyrophosphatase MutT (NUDIX family)
MRISYERTARAIITQGQYMLVCQGMREAFLHLAGGHIEEGETPETALRRELQEEIGVTVTTLTKLGIIETMWPRFAPEGITEVREEMHLYGVEVTLPHNYRGEYWLTCYWVDPRSVLEQIVPKEAHSYILQITG